MFIRAVSLAVNQCGKERVNYRNILSRPNSECLFRQINRQRLNGQGTNGRTGADKRLMGNYQFYQIHLVSSHIKNIYYKLCLNIQPFSDFETYKH